MNKDIKADLKKLLGGDEKLTDEAEALWNGAPLHQAAVQLNHRHRTALRGRLRTHWKPLATAAVLLVGLLTFGNLPVRLQADHLTVVGERQRLQLDDGTTINLQELLNQAPLVGSEPTIRKAVFKIRVG